MQEILIIYSEFTFSLSVILLVFGSEVETFDLISINFPVKSL